MSGSDRAPYDDEAEGALVRPFLARASGQPISSGSSGSETFVDESLVRPYYVTGGRTQTGSHLTIEALVQLTDAGRQAQAGLRLERRVIANVCTHTVSVAEIAARARLHLGVARVLIADMESEGLIKTSVAPAGVADDIDLITRLIHGVRAL